MISRRTKFLLCASFVGTLLTARDAHGDPVSATVVAEPGPLPDVKLRMRKPSTLTLGSGRIILLPPGRWIEEETFSKDELELKRLQAVETRITAENISLRKSAQEWKPGWVTISLSVATGIGLGIFLHDRLQ